MARSKNHWRTILFRPEAYEWLSLLMLAVIDLIYRIGLRSSLLGAIRHTFYQSGPVTKAFLLFLVGLGAICLLLRRGRHASWSTFALRAVACLFVTQFCFESVNAYIDAKELPLVDSMLQHWDSVLFFGKQPAEWLEPIINRPLTLLLSGAYLTWFALVIGTIFLMLLRSRRAAITYTGTALLTFYIGYLIYMIVPGIGPMYTYHYDVPVGGLTAVLSNPGLIKPSANVFPSLHTALSVVMMVRVWQERRSWFWLYGPVCTLIICATIYLRIHYVVDVLAGITLASITSWLYPKVMKAWEAGREAALARSQTPIPTDSRAPGA